MTVLSRPIYRRSDTKPVRQGVADYEGAPMPEPSYFLDHYGAG